MLAEKTVSLKKKARPLLPHQMAARRSRGARRHARAGVRPAPRAFVPARRVPARRQLQRLRDLRGRGHRDRASALDGRVRAGLQRVPLQAGGTLCGARGAYLRGHYLWVAATQVDAVTVVDVYRPDMPTVAGSVSDPTRLKAVVAVWAHDSGEYVVAIARGVRPTGFGHVTIVDVARTACGEKTHSGGTSRSPESWRRRETASPGTDAASGVCAAPGRSRWLANSLTSPPR